MEMKKKIKKVIKSKYFIGSIIITIIYGIMLFIGKAFPFGKNTILVSDLKTQYINFFCYLKNILLGTKGIFMSWNLGMANDFYTNFIYYLLNPINILVLFFDNSKMYIFVELALYLKLLLIFNCFTLYIEKVFNYNRINAILFGIAYTFSSFVISYYFNIMWLDVLYVLPISILFINNYIKTGKMYPIILSYIYIQFVQYYMAYSMIIFCSIYYVVMCLLQERITKDSIKRFIRKTIPLAIATVLSVCMAMIIYMPTLNLMNQISGLNEQNINIDKLTLTDFLNNFTNYFEYSTTQNIGFAFSGSLITVLMLSFFINKNITTKEKIIYGYLLLFLFLPVIFPKIYKIWHAGTNTNGFNFRYCYLTMFVLITIAFKSYKSLANNSKKHFILLYIFFGGVELFKIIQFFNSVAVELRLDYLFKIIFSMMIFGANITLIWISKNQHKNSNIKKTLFALLIIIEIIDICLVIKYNIGYGISIDNYNQYDSLISNVVNRIENPETERIIIDEDEYGNNSLKYNYSSFYYFASGRRIKTLQNMNKIGYTTNYNAFDRHSKTLVTDIMSGIKYYVLNNESAGNIKKNVNFNNLLEYIGQLDNTKYLYQNNYAFPFAYYIPKKINIIENGDIIEVQNRILNNYGKETNEKFIYNIKDTDNIVSYKKNNIKIKNDKENEFFNNTIQYNGKALRDTDVYIKYGNDKFPIFIKSENKYEMALGNTRLFMKEVNEEIRKTFCAKDNIRHFASLKKGDNFLLEIDINKESFNEEDLEIYFFDSEKIKNKIKSIKQDIFELNKIKKNGMEGTIELDEDGFVCFEIAYDDGWHIEIDGKEIEKEAIYDVFLGAKLEKGKHNINIYYIPIGLKLGALISIFSGIGLSILLIIYKKNADFI